MEKTSHHAHLCSSTTTSMATSNENRRTFTKTARHHVIDNEEASRHPANTQKVVILAFRQRKSTHFFCVSTTPKHAEGWLSFVRSRHTGNTGNTQRVVVFAFYNTQTRRGLSFVRSRHVKNTHRGLSFMRSRHPRNTQRVTAFAFRQRHNTQRVVIHAVTTPRQHAEGHRFCVSTPLKHAEGCRSCDHDTPRPCRRSSFLRFDNVKTRRRLSFIRSRHATPTQTVIVFAFQQCQNMQRVIALHFFNQLRLPPTHHGHHPSRHSSRHPYNDDSFNDNPSAEKNPPPCLREL